MSTVRKELVWNIKKNLYRLSCDDVYKLAKDIASDSSQDLESSDEESCVNYILYYMQSDTLLESEDEGMSDLLMLNDLVKSIIDNPVATVITKGVTQKHTTLTTVPTLIEGHTTFSHVNDDMPTTSHFTALSTTTNHTTQQHANLDRDITTQSMDQLQAMHEDLGEKLQYYKDMASTQ
jgi:hypothetical protein